VEEDSSSSSSSSSSSNSNYIGEKEKKKIVLIGHSAGGWILRLFVGDKPYDGKVYNGFEKNKGQIVSLVTLGTPHNSAEAYPFGKVIEKRRVRNHGDDMISQLNENETSLQETRRIYPNCYFQHLQYITVCGTGFYGRPFRISDFMKAPLKNWKPIFNEVKHGISYKTDCLQYEANGDGTTCLSSGLGLLGAQNEIEIEGCTHNKSIDHPWYGSYESVRIWSKPITEHLVASM
jgi:hypothetical protein